MKVNTPHNKNTRLFTSPSNNYPYSPYTQYAKHELEDESDTDESLTSFEEGKAESIEISQNNLSPHKNVVTLYNHITSKDKYNKMVLGIARKLKPFVSNKRRKICIEYKPAIQTERHKSLIQRNSRINFNLTIPVHELKIGIKQESAKSYRIENMKKLQNKVKVYMKEEIIKRLKEEVTNSRININKYRNELRAQKTIIEKQKEKIETYEENKASREKLNKDTANELKQRITILETVNKQLVEENVNLRDTTTHYEHLYTKLKQKYQTQKKLAEEYKQKFNKANRSIEEYELESSKQANKIRELKKERDNLKMINLKQRQEYISKCESYRNVKTTLRKEIKLRNEKILKLQKKIKSINKNEISSLYTESCSRAKSLENTAKHPLKNLASLIQLEEISSELEKQTKGTIEFGSKSFAEGVPHNTERKNRGESSSNDQYELTPISIVIIHLTLQKHAMKNPILPYKKNKEVLKEIECEEFTIYSSDVLHIKILQSQSEQSNLSIHHPESFPYPKLKFSAKFHGNCEERPSISREDKKGFVGILKNSFVQNQLNKEKRNILLKCTTSLQKSETNKAKLIYKKVGK